jgi:hypothetical protein
MEPEKIMSRRDFLEKLLFCLPSIVGFGTLMGNAIGGIRVMIKLKNEKDPKIVDVKVNEVNYKLMGVEHRLEYLSTYYPLFYSLIKNSDAVVLENYEKKLDFWSGIRILCKELNKDIYVVDPAATDNGTYHVAFDTVAAFFYYYLLCLSPLLLDKQIKTSRRKFLSISLSQLFFFPLFLGSYFGSWSAALIDREAPFTYGIDDKISYGSFDYRNIKIANHLEKLSKILEPKPKNYMLVIYGATHTGPIEYYLKNPEERKRKEFIYDSTLIFPAISNTSILHYKCKNDEWELIEKIP